MQQPDEQPVEEQLAERERRQDGDERETDRKGSRRLGHWLPIYHETCVEGGSRLSYIYLPMKMLMILAMLGGAAAAEPAMVVVIDAGHGGSNTGAPGRAPGAFEKQVTLAVARVLQNR